MEEHEDPVVTAQWQIVICERPSAEVSKELLDEVIRLRRLLDMAWDAIGEAGYEDHCWELREALGR